MTDERPLSELTVVDCSAAIPGPYATRLLQRLGARVIKVEPPQGDVARLFPLVDEALNAGKESVAVDLKDPADLLLVRTMSAAADVFVEGWRPGVADRLGLGYDDLCERNPGLVYCSISGYGATGELSERPGHDLNYVAASGMAHILFGDSAPAIPGVPLADLAGGTFAALRIACALLGARAHGSGARVDVSLAGAVRDWVDAVGGRHSTNALELLTKLPHYGVFETADGERLVLGTANEDHFWKALCERIGLHEWAGLGLADRAARADDLRAALAAWAIRHRRAELEQVLAPIDTCWSFVEDPTSAPPIGGMLPPSPGSAPILGEHSDALREEFGTSRPTVANR